LEISKIISKDILNRLLNIYTSDYGEIIALHEPTFSNLEKEYVISCIETGMVSSIGKYVDEFEDIIASYTGAKYAVATVNGTTALHLALVVSNLPKGSEVIVPSLSFIASANAVIHANLVPHFVNSEPVSLGIDTDRLIEYLDRVATFQDGVLFNKISGRLISAILPTHCFGHPCLMNGILDIANNFNLTVIEDAAEALGSFFQGKHCGTLGNIGILSFNGNKVLTTGGGGILLTNDKDVFKEAKHLSTTAKKSTQFSFEHDQIGYNYRMPNLNAALGIAQYHSLEKNLTKKRKLAARLHNSFHDFAFGKIFTQMSGVNSNYWLNALVLETEFGAYRDIILKDLNSQNLMARPCWAPLHNLPMYTENPKDDLSATEVLASNIINLPSSPALA
tara:strand:- start:2147 stop:3322 length:1176 start_codon:yes stop_codon:yes gene_type:complete